MYDLLRFLNTIMYPHNERFMDIVSEYIDFSQNEELKQEVKKVMGIGQITFESGVETGIKTGIEAFVLDNEEEGIPRERVIEKLQRRFGISEEKAIHYYEKFAIQDRLMV